MGKNVENARPLNFRECSGSCKSRARLYGAPFHGNPGAGTLGGFMVTSYPTTRFGNMGKNGTQEPFIWSPLNLWWAQV
jgi:hypothetical protein